MVGARIKWVDVCKGIAILFIVLRHANGTNELGNDAPFASPLIDLMNAFVWPLLLPAFFFASGIFAPAWFTKSWKEVLVGRVFPYWWLAFVWSVFASIIEFPADWDDSGAHVAYESLVRNLLLSPVLPRKAVWFLLTLALMFVLAKLLGRLPIVTHLVVAVIVTAVFSSLNAWAGYTFDNPITAERVYAGVLNYYLFFVLGAYLGKKGANRIGQFSTLWAVLLALAGVLIMVGAFCAGINELPVVGLLLRIVGLVVVVSVSVLLGNSPAGSLPILLGKGSLEILVLHVQIISVTLFALSVFWSAAPHALAVLTATILSITGALVLRALVRKSAALDMILFSPHFSKP